MTEATIQTKSSPWLDPARLVRYLGRLLKDPRVPKSAKLKLAGAGLYAWVDGDIISDTVKLVPGLGYVDDLILVVHGIKCLIAETEPAVAVELWPGGANTQGGPRRNARSQIMNVDGEAIPGLYGAGEMGSIYGMLYPGGGGNLAECIAMGRVAGENVAHEC